MTDTTEVNDLNVQIKAILRNLKPLIKKEFPKSFLFELIRFLHAIVVIIGFFILMPALTIFSSVLVDRYISNSFLYKYEIGFIFILCSVILSCILTYWNHGLIDRLIRSIKKDISTEVNGILSYHTLFGGASVKIQNIDEIVTYTEGLKSILNFTSKFHFFAKFILPGDEIRQNLEHLIKLETHWTYLILLDLREDLLTRMKEQSVTLEKATENLKTSLRDKPELQGIIALQSARLDKQIEAFEKLQKRVLV